ncbi:MAG: hypothetical protein HS117_19275 [Verrucomicrobiaceae bacterium]|nr:hypothetical protein [Verrucomicrobiaceae bacterium]
MINWDRHFKPFCLHGETDTHDGTCQNMRLPGSSFCAEHTPPVRPHCGTHAFGDHLQRYRVVSRKGIYPDEETWVCEDCLRNDAANFEFIPITQ